MAWQVLGENLDIRGVVWHHLTSQHVPGPLTLIRNAHIIRIQRSDSV